MFEGVTELLDYPIHQIFYLVFQLVNNVKLRENGDVENINAHIAKVNIPVINT